MLHSFAESHIGQRKINEDSFLIDEGLGLYIVADGVGGMSKGEIASTLACETTSDCIKSGMGLEEAIRTAHKKIVSQIQSDDKKQGMASTIVAALFKDNSYEIAWVGDSRAYVWDDNLKLLTRDDSYVELLLENGHIGIEDLETHPDRNVISQALGIVRKDIRINYNSGTLENDQILLLCSDGLYSIADEKSIIASLKKNHNIQQLTQSLIEQAVENDGKDNITLLSIISHENSASINDIVKPKVYRKFDLDTGIAVGYESKINLESNNENIESGIDPELVDQTELKDLSVVQQNLLDTAASQFVESKELNRKTTPIILVSILVLIVVILFFNQMN